MLRPILLLTFALTSVSSTCARACQMVCSGEESLSLILCDVEVDHFSAILWYRDENNKVESAELIDRIFCHVDDKEGQLAECPGSAAPDGEKISFRSEIRKNEVNFLDPISGEKKSRSESYVDVKIRGPEVLKLPQSIKGREGDTLKLSFLLKECPSQTRAQREAKFKR